MTGLTAVAGARLDVQDLRKSFYGVRALDDVSFAVGSGDLVGLLGPNGSGKTTAIDCISGLQSPDGGRVMLDGHSIFRRAPDWLAQRDAIRTFQGVRVFATLSVRSNLAVAALGRLRRFDRVSAYLRGQRAWRGVDERIDELVDAFGLRAVEHLPAGQLSHGQCKLVEFAAACLKRPRLLLLDEPVAAVNPTMANVIAEWIRSMHREGCSIILVEHDIEFVVGLCHRLVVLDHGKKLAEGDPDAVVSRAEVQEAYFGR